MAVLGGLETVEGERAAVRFSCPGWHEAAIRRTFLEACKLDPATVEARPLEIGDGKTGLTIRVESLGAGVYRVRADGEAEDREDRARAVANGLAKLAELERQEDDAIVSFACRTAHDSLVGLLLPRALNVRAALREEESASSRGVLVAPSAQEGAGAP
jgi:hypothetical protein